MYLWMIMQIICESLPISSSGHVVLLQQIMERFQFFGGQADGQAFQDLWAFDYLLQGISAIIIFIYFFPGWWQLIIDRPMQISSLLDFDLWKKNILPVFIFGLVADSMTFLLWYVHIQDYLKIPLAVGFMITALVLWSMQFTQEKKDITIWSWKNGLVVGLVQGCALLPGISRFAATIATLQWLGYSSRLAFAISFLIQCPLIVAGSLAGFYSLSDASILKVVWTVPFLMVLLVAGYVAYQLLVLVGEIIDKKLLWKFSYYMIIPMIIALFV